MKISPVAGKPADETALVDGPRQITAYYTEAPGPAVRLQRVASGPSGHRGSLLEKDDAYAPTPAISHAILACNRGRPHGLSDGIVITLSHNPPHGGPAETAITDRIETKANGLLCTSPSGVKRISCRQALSADPKHRHDCLTTLGERSSFGRRLGGGSGRGDQARCQSAWRRRSPLLETDCGALRVEPLSADTARTCRKSGTGNGRRRRQQRDARRA